MCSINVVHISFVNQCWISTTCVSYPILLAHSCPVTLAFFPILGLDTRHSLHLDCMAGFFYSNITPSETALLTTLAKAGLPPSSHSLSPLISSLALSLSEIILFVSLLVHSLALLIGHVSYLGPASYLSGSWLCCHCQKQCLLCTLEIYFWRNE